ncbi:MAG: imidazole glycerol phosphate synthase subunit HisH [Dehalococcoidia bacterium]
MVGIVDYGVGNLGSIRNMLRRIGTEAELVSTPDHIARATRFILPGVGSFDRAMTRLKESGLIPSLEEAVLRQGRPLLGICLGMQLLTKSSEEGAERGLGWVNAVTRRFRLPDQHRETLRLPNMGWRHVDWGTGHKLTEDLPPDSRYYFAHTYYVQCESDENVLGRCWYGRDFHAALVSGNVVGTQFHPEKSHRHGMRVLEQFLEYGT